MISIYDLFSNNYWMSIEWNFLKDFNVDSVSLFRLATESDDSVASL
jgi:hypothetical protein